MGTFSACFGLKENNLGNGCAHTLRQWAIKCSVPVRSCLQNVDFEIYVLLVSVMDFILKVFTLTCCLLKGNVLMEIPKVSHVFNEALSCMVRFSAVRLEACVQA